MLDSNDVMSLFRFSRSTLYRHVRDRNFPEPIYVGKHPLWHKETIEKWLKDSHGLALKPQQAARKKRDIDGLC